MKMKRFRGLKGWGSRSREADPHYGLWLEARFKLVYLGTGCKILNHMPPRDIKDLEDRAFKFWPTELAKREKSSSIIPMLIESQEKFIGILYVADKSPTAWKDVLCATQGMPANLFLKHLIVLSDVGGERLQRYRSNIHKFFPDGNMTFHWKDATHTHTFKSLKTVRTWTNAKLKVGGAGLLTEANLTDALEDVAMLLIHGGSSVDADITDDIPEKCVIGSLIGKKAELDTFVRQRYINVSRVTRGATANAMGQLCQSYVAERLKGALPKWDFSRHTIPDISHNAGRTDMSFDIVAESPKRRYCAIEISFQVTTNSVIERKGGQAAARKQILNKAGHKIAYVIDGAGNFQRRSAIKNIIANSDCTVSFTDDELDSLATFLKTLE